MKGPRITDHKKIRKDMKMTKETWKKTNARKWKHALEITPAKSIPPSQRITVNKDKATSLKDNCLTEEPEILNRWTKYCSDVSSYETDQDSTILDYPQIPDKEPLSNLGEEMEGTVKSLKMGEVRVDNIPTEFVKAGDDAMIGVLT